MASVSVTAAPLHKRVYRISIAGATDVSNVSLAGSNDLSAGGPVNKVEEVDLVAALRAARARDIPEKLEGLAIGPRLADGRHLVLVGSDNDYSVTQSAAGEQFEVCVPARVTGVDSLRPLRSSKPCFLDSFHLIGQNQPFVRLMPGAPNSTRFQVHTSVGRGAMRSHRKSLLGVTLVELVVSMAVLAILASTALPSFVDLLDRNRARGAADDVASLISHARAAAVQNNLDVSIAMVGSGTAWCIGGNAAAAPSGGLPAGAADPCDCEDATACRIAGQRFAIEVDAHPGVQVGNLPAPLTFDSTLGVISPLGSRSVVLTSPRGTYDVAIQINPLGQSRLCTPAGRPAIPGTPTC